MTTNVPAPRPRHQFPEISAVSWEHPADRAALQALRAVPGVDEVIRKVLALLGGERGVRLLFQGNAIRVGPTQFPRLWHLHTEVTTTFDWPEVPELYVSQTPFFNAGAYGLDKPFIVIHSAAIELLDDDELRVLLSHELGHVMSGHALYRTIAEGLDVVYKILSTLALTHPMHTVRAAELQRWVTGGDYDRILRGEYVRRGPDSAERPISEDFAAAGSYYAAEAKEVATQVAEAA